MTSVQPAGTWKRLGELLVRRRIELDPAAFANRERFCRERGIHPRIVADIENARRDNYEPRTRTQVEVAYRLAPGSFDRTLETGVLEPLPEPDSQPSPPERASLGVAIVDPADTARWREWVASLTDSERDLLAEAMREYPLDPVAWHLWLTPRITTAERRALVEALQTLRRGENPSREETA